MLTPCARQGLISRGAEIHLSPVLNPWIWMELFWKGMSIVLIEWLGEAEVLPATLQEKLDMNSWKGQRFCQPQSSCLSGGCRRGVFCRGDTSLGRPGESKAAAGSFAPRRSSHHQQSLFWDNYLIRTKPRWFLFPKNKLIKSAVSMTVRQPYICHSHNIFLGSAWTFRIQSQHALINKEPL